MGRPAIMLPARGEDYSDHSGGTKKRFACADERKKAKVLALQGHVWDLQRQLEQMELERTHNRAQLETLRQYVHEPSEPPPPKISACSTLDVALKAPEERLGGWRPSMPMGATGDSRHELCDEGAGQVARVMTALRGAGAPFTTPAECKTLSAADMADFHEELVDRVRTLLERGAHVTGSPAAQELEWLILQRRNIWCMGAHAAVWRNSPGLYYALISEIIRRAVALHGLPGSDDFDVKLAAMALTAAQRSTIIREAEDMRAEVVAMFEKQRAVFAKPGTLPPAGPMDAPDNSMSCKHPVAVTAMLADLLPLCRHTLEMLEVQGLVGRLGDVIGAFSARVWMHTTALQHARGLTATPYILCGVTVGAHLMAPRDGLIAACHAGSMMEVVEWLRTDDAERCHSLKLDNEPVMVDLAAGPLAA